MGVFAAIAVLVAPMAGCIGDSSPGSAPSSASTPEIGRLEVNVSTTDPPAAFGVHVAFGDEPARDINCSLVLTATSVNGPPGHVLLSVSNPNPELLLYRDHGLAVQAGAARDPEDPGTGRWLVHVPFTLTDPSSFTFLGRSLDRLELDSSCEEPVTNATVLAGDDVAVLTPGRFDEGAGGKTKLSEQELTARASASVDASWTGILEGEKVLARGSFPGDTATETAQGSWTLDHPTGEETWRMPADDQELVSLATEPGRFEVEATHVHAGAGASLQAPGSPPVLALAGVGAHPSLDAALDSIGVED